MKLEIFCKATQQSNTNNKDNVRSRNQLGRRIYRIPPAHELYKYIYREYPSSQIYIIKTHRWQLLEVYNYHFPDDFWLYNGILLRHIWWNFALNLWPRRLFDFEAPARHEFEPRSSGDEENPLRRSLSAESIPRSQRTVVDFLS